MTERSILAAVSGIQANQTYLDGIGNNIANADTIGFKDSQVQFQDLLAEQLSGASGPAAGSAGVNPVAVGSGVRVAANEVNLQEGSLEQTGVPTDVAIQGSGYLVVQSGGQQFYTRDGSLTTDGNGNLSTQSGGLIQGWQANGQGTVNTNAPLTSIKIPTGETIGATATTTLTLGGNLPAWNGVGTSPTETTTLNAYDALGDVVPITLTFTGVAGAANANQWTVQGTVPKPSGGTDTLWTTAPTIVFNPASGQVTSVTGATTNADGSLSVPVSTMPAGYTFPAGDILSFTFPPPGSSAAVTQFSAASTVQIEGQNGYASGTLQTYSIGSDGTITGAFSNGATLALGQIALANFTNAGGLSDQGGGLYATSPNSGQALIGTPGTGGRGALLGGELEQSNVNLGTELTNLITAQQAYTANTKVLTTSSQVMQALENVQ
ncbi:MAG: protein of unknown function domain protein [Acidimicrobiaceae bacterium]|jgi:flagellar hook protein FlgE|nr:protein of unknown function domain protein [Acidimicrobiaceae bacterium]